jgi:hypothetical protein
MPPMRRIARRTARRTANRQADMAAPPPEAPAAAPPPAPAAPDSTAELQQLAALHEQGILTDEEFEAKKKQILGL